MKLGLRAAYQMTWMMTRMSSTMMGTVRCSSSLCTAALVLPDCKQSMERAPLVTLAKAKLAALRIQWMGAGAEMLTLPSRVMYCSHSVSACRYSSHCSAQSAMFSVRRVLLMLLANALLQAYPRRNSLIWHCSGYSG